MRSTGISILTSVLLAAVAAQGSAQVASTPTALGMGGAFDGVARGNESIFLNPALLGLRGTPFWSVAFPQVAVGGTLLGTEFGDLRPIMRYRRVTEEQRDEILSRVPPNGTEARYQVRLPLASVQQGNLALALSYSSVGQHRIARDVLELLFDGYQEGRTDYTAGDSRGSRGTFWDLAAAYGKAVGPLSVGATAHYYRGGTLLRSRLFDPHLELDVQDIEVEYRTVLTRGGHGYGVDLGAAFQPSPSITISSSLSNVVSRMSWSQDLQMRTLKLNRHDIEHENPLDLISRYEESEMALDPESAPLASLALAEQLYDGMIMPSVVRVGAAWKGGQGTDIGVSFRRELDESRLGDFWSRSAGVGVQQRLPLVTLRAGYATNLDGGNMTTGGLSLGVLQIGLARLHDEQVDGFERAGWIGTFGISVGTTGTMRTPGAIR
ncbi:hypothetical protein BH23GEM6_BH23GEM6_10000 [soil metagenome]